MRTRRRTLAACGTGLDLAASMARINKRHGAEVLVLGEPEHTDQNVARGWHRCADLLDDPVGFAAWHKALSEWLGEEFGEAPDCTAAGFIKAWYLQVPAFVGALLFHHERRVPTLRPENLAFRIAADGRPDPVASAVATPEFACLPDDPAAGTPEATVVASEHALAELLRARFIGHAAGFVAAYQPPVHFGRHTMWGAATDALDVALWKAGKLGGDEGAGVADAALVLPDRIAPFTSASTLHTTTGDDGGQCWTRRKESCCFNYLLAEGSGACATCPRRSPPL